VWVCNLSKHHNYQQAESFGNVAFLVHDYLPTFNSDVVLDELADRIEHLTDVTDYLLLSGHQLINAVAVALWIQRHGAVRLLSWSRKDVAYRVHDLNKDRMEAALERALIFGGEKDD
jgi:hypothetical protein